MQTINPSVFSHTHKKSEAVPTQKVGVQKFIFLSFALHNGQDYQGIPDISGRLTIS